MHVLSDGQQQAALTTSAEEPRSWRSSPTLAAADTAAGTGSAAACSGVELCSTVGLAAGALPAAASVNRGGGARCSCCRAASPGASCKVGRAVHVSGVTTRTAQYHACNCLHCS